MKWLLAALLFFPFVFAFDCSDVQMQDYCAEVKATTLSDLEKDTLIGASIADSTLTPDFDTVEDWNMRIPFSNAPSQVPTYSQGTINNAWMKIVSLMPAVSSGALLSPGYGTLLSAYNYSITLPSGTAGGDCQTSYQQAFVSDRQEVLLNGQKIGEGRICPFSASADMDFLGKLTIQSAYDIYHYRWIRQCCNKKIPKKYCTKWCTTCEYSGSDRITDTLLLQDNLSAQYYNPSIDPDIRLNNKYYGTQNINLNISNQTSFYLTFSNGTYFKSDYHYFLAWTLPPYDVLGIRAIPYETEFVNNTIIYENGSEFQIITPTSDCHLSFRNHFDSFQMPCNLSKKEDTLTYDKKEIQTEDFTPSLISFGLLCLFVFGVSQFFKKGMDEWL